MSLANLLIGLANRFAREKFVITRSWTQLAYLSRWTLFGQRFGEHKGYAVFLHQFHRSDADEMHDHPWPFVSIILSGGYVEKTPGTGWKNGNGPVQRRWYGPGRVLFRPAHWIHSVEVDENGPPVITLILRGKKQRSWGFWCPTIGYRPWRVHLAAAENNPTHNGCE